MRSAHQKAKPLRISAKRDPSPRTHNAANSSHLRHGESVPQRRKLVVRAADIVVELKESFACFYNARGHVGCLRVCKDPMRLSIRGAVKAQGWFDGAKPNSTSPVKRHLPESEEASNAGRRNHLWWQSSRFIDAWGTVTRKWAGFASGLTPSSANVARANFARDTG